MPESTSPVESRVSSAPGMRVRDWVIVAGLLIGNAVWTVAAPILGILAVLGFFGYLVHGPLLVAALLGGVIILLARAA